MEIIDEAVIVSAGIPYIFTSYHNVKAIFHLFRLKTFSTEVIKIKDRTKGKKFQKNPNREIQHILIIDVFGVIATLILA